MHYANTFSFTITTLSADHSQIKTLQPASCHAQTFTSNLKLNVSGVDDLDDANHTVKHESELLTIICEERETDNGQAWCVVQ